MREGTITVGDGRIIGFTDYGRPGQTAVLWCHGGPGCRIEPEIVAAQAAASNLRIIGIDRPGYGHSTPLPGRTIAGWVPDALAVMDHLVIDRFITAGLSTGGAYALAVAATSRRAIGVVACGALSDMRRHDLKAQMPDGLPVWNAPDRAATKAVVAALMGEDGSKVNVHSGAVPLPASDRAIFADPATRDWWTRCIREWFRQGVDGYADDRIADGRGWDTFDVTAIACPVSVIHGGSDPLAVPANAHHTAAIVPGATLRVFEPLGHFSICMEAIPAIDALLMRIATPLQPSKA
jgi:pimeloyl-ACP methyl ester carboxylesterase